MIAIAAVCTVIWRNAPIHIIWRGVSSCAKIMLLSTFWCVGRSTSICAAIATGISIKGGSGLVVLGSCLYKDINFTLFECHGSLLLVRRAQDDSMILHNHFYRICGPH